VLVLILMNLTFGSQCHFIMSVTTAVRIRTLSVDKLKLNLVSHSM